MSISICLYIIYICVYIYIYMCGYIYILYMDIKVVELGRYHVLGAHAESSPGNWDSAGMVQLVKTYQKLWKTTMFAGQINYKWPCSIAFCMFTRG